MACLIKYPNRTTSTGPSHHLRTYRLATLVSIPLVVSLLLFWTITHGQASLVLAWDILPQAYLFLLVLLFLLPLQYTSKAGRYRFLSTLKRVSIGGIAEGQDGKFGDILLADALTSYSKVLGDMFVSACMFLSSKYSSTAKPDRGCGGAYLVPLIISIPSLIRLRQCFIEYLRVRRSLNQPWGSLSSGWGGQHLANALKYSSVFPVIILSALQRGYDPTKIGMSETGLFRLWLVVLCLHTRDPAQHYNLGSSLFSSTLSIPSIGTWREIGISLCSLLPKNAMILNTLGVCVGIPISMPRKCIMEPY